MDDDDEADDVEADDDEQRGRGLPASVPANHACGGGRATHMAAGGKSSPRKTARSRCEMIFFLCVGRHPSSHWVASGRSEVIARGKTGSFGPREANGTGTSACSSAPHAHGAVDSSAAPTVGRQGAAREACGAGAGRVGERASIGRYMDARAAYAHAHVVRTVLRTCM
ncbi:hypothetical protein DCS_01899 [Drechmeria coniospora]|uniref:Uncharacterized protein n=1 Tax=Drechmeria coniospora TaxID=98403 RepID=A0A151GUL5_DRECN|nr:hypothetical protein DCS_01899 [Drechmeria coniospora]KYK60761.1 hypothetical protein DCS_01899 [Drechmeria coniospora]